MRHLLLFCSLLVGLSGAAWGNTVDPFIGLDDPGCPEGGICPNITTFSSDTNGGGTSFFENLTGSTITALQFQAEVKSFDPTNFSCDSVYFLNCNFSAIENANGDLLTINFFGVNAPDIETGCDTEFKEFEGIPVYDAACVDSGINQGVIAITLNNQPAPGQYDLTPLGTGGWNAFIPNGQSKVSFTTTLVSTPEPSTAIPLGVGLLLLTVVGRWRIRRAGNF